MEPRRRTPVRRGWQPTPAANGGPANAGTGREVVPRAAPPPPRSLRALPQVGLPPRQRAPDGLQPDQPSEGSDLPQGRCRLHLPIAHCDCRSAARRKPCIAAPGDDEDGGRRTFLLLRASWGCCNHARNTLPEIEARISDGNVVMLRIHCEDGRGWSSGCWPRSRDSTQYHAYTIVMLFSACILIINVMAKAFGLQGLALREYWITLQFVECCKKVSTFLHAREGEAVTKLTNEKVPYFNAPIYLQNKTQIGKVEEKMVAAIRVPKTQRARRELLKHAPKLVETSKKTLILHGTKTSAVLNSVLSDIYHLKRDNAVKYTKKNDNIRPFESGGESSLEFFSLKTDCSLIVYGSHSKKRPNNLILGRTYDHHIYDLVEVGIENYKSMESYVYDKKLAPKLGSKPFFAFIGEHFESAEELKHLKEVLLDLFRGEVVENLNLAGVDRIYVCTAISPTTVYMMHCALRLKRSGTSIPRMELVEVGPSMDLVVRRHRLPVESLKKEAMKTAEHAKKMKNVTKDPVHGKLGKVYMPDQQVAKLTLSNDIKGLKRERREAKKNKDLKKQKVNPE